MTTTAKYGTAASSPDEEGATSNQAGSRPVTWYVEEQASSGVWREETVSPEVTGLSREVRIFRAPRKTNLIVYDWHGDVKTFCPPQWWDLAIGSGACHFGCRACFLLLTHRIRRDPWRHLLYDNLDDFERVAEKWLLDPARRRQHTLGVGIDRSDSLLYEGIAPHVRNLAPLFESESHNPKGNKLVLLTKSANTHFLEEVRPEHRGNVVVSFSLNPEGIADLWEGKWPDTGERITPPIVRRLQAARFAQDLGFEVRVRVDPILTPVGWEEQYRAFVALVKEMGVRFRYWTLGTYREKNAQLDGWRERWGLLPMEWQPSDGDGHGDGEGVEAGAGVELVKSGTHWHLPDARRITIYGVVRDAIKSEFPGSVTEPAALVSLCKETHSVRRALNLCNASCNCLT